MEALTVLSVEGERYRSILVEDATAREATDLAEMDKIWF